MAAVLVAPCGCLRVAVATVLLTCLLAQFGHGVSSDSPSSFEAFWQSELPNVAMPASLQQATSPLSPYSSRLLVAHLLAGSDPQSLSDELCSSAPVYCAQAVTVLGGPQPRVCIPPFFKYEYGVLPCPFGASMVAEVADSGIFFQTDALTLGRTLHFPDTANDVSKVVFLPSSLASAFPVNLEHASDLQSLFAVPEGSQLELDMMNTAAHCSFQSNSPEVRGCESSGEALVSFVTQTLGDKVVILSAAALSQQNVRVADVHPLNSGYQKSVTCHTMKFPSLVYSCHMIPSTKVFDVSIVEVGGQVAHVLAVCHSDTSYWDPNHIAFKVLKTEPGLSTICHWLPENTLVFVQQ